MEGPHVTARIGPADGGPPLVSAPGSDASNPPEHRLEEAFERFFAEARIKPGTRRSYRANAANWLRHFPGLPLAEVDRPLVTEFVSRRKREGVTDATIRRDIAFLSSVFAMAVMWGVVEENRVQRFNKRFLKEARPRTRFLTRGEYRRLIAAASPALRPLIALAVETGMRKEEMLGLRLSAIDLARREVHLEDTKNNKPRRVPLSDGAVAAIERVLGDPMRPRSSYLFCKPDGSRILCTKKGFAAACRRAGITDFRFHDLRHTFASWWVQNGGDLYKLSRILGHQTLQMSARYGHLRTDDLHEEIERVTRRRRASEEARAM